MSRELAFSDLFFAECLGLGELDIDPLVAQAVAGIGEVGQNVRPIVLPLGHMHASDASELALVLGQGAAIEPALQEQQDVGTMLNGGQMGGVGEVVSRVKRHPDWLAHGAIPIWRSAFLIT